MWMLLLLLLLELGGIVDLQLSHLFLHVGTDLVTLVGSTKMRGGGCG
jgi:hypothetical protein